MPAAAPRRRRGCLLFSLILLGVLAGGLGGGLLYRHLARWSALQAQQQRAQEEFGPVLDALTTPATSQPAPGSTEPPPPAYDIDRTIKVLHTIELAARQQRSLGSFLEYLARLDYRDVAPEVLEHRKKIFAILQRLYARQTEQEQQEEMWSYTSDLLLTMLGALDLQGGVGAVPNFSFAIDQEQFRKQHAELKEKRQELRQAISEVETELLQELFTGSAATHRYLDEWDRLCAIRDRAYLAVAEGNWEAAAATAQQAIRQAPREKEAHLLLALAQLEGQSSPPEVQPLADGAPLPSIDPGAAETLLRAYVEQHPESTAPALLLLGVAARRRGDRENATLYFQQASAYFPRQADQFGEVADAYRARSYLRKSREGRYILDMYRSTMLGAGYFSPDLQLARHLLDQGDRKGAERKVLDHFFRRRNQGQWDLILSDIEFCNRYLGEHFRQLLPENSYLDLVYSPTTFGSRVAVALRNRSDVALHNGTLVAALHFTDMYPEDYEAFVVGSTQPVIAARQQTDFGKLDIHWDFLGKEKTVDDIVSVRAILIADEAVTWVDTEEFKLAEVLSQERQRLARTAEPQPAAVPVSPLANRVLSQALSAIQARASLKARPQLGQDGVDVTLPREAAALRPVFRLKLGDRTISPKENVIDGDHISLHFDDVANLENALPDTISLEIASPFGNFTTNWQPFEQKKFQLKSISGDRTVTTSTTAPAPAPAPSRPAP